jgi:hypothetical protein
MVELNNLGVVEEFCNTWQKKAAASTEVKYWVNTLSHMFSAL